MGTGEHSPPNLQSWVDFAKEKLAPGSSVVWEWEPLDPVVGWLGDRLMLSPIIILKRFVEDADVTLGCRVMQISPDGVRESTCLLTYEDLAYLLTMTEDHSDDDQLVSICSKSVVLRTRSGFVLEWSRMSPYVAVSAACSRQVCLNGAKFTQLRSHWSQCHEFMTKRNPGDWP